MEEMRDEDEDEEMEEEETEDEETEEEETEETEGARMRTRWWSGRTRTSWRRVTSI
jgi:hypothetical protein